MVNWKKYYNNIPSKIKIGKNVYEVLWISEFLHDQTQLGESRFGELRQIIINKNQPIKEAVHTYWHEIIHAISEEYEVGMTEKQVLAFEKSLKIILDSGNMFKKEGSNGKVQRNKSYKRKRRNFKRIRQIS